MKYEREISNLPDRLSRYGLTVAEYHLMESLVERGCSRAQLAVLTFESTRSRPLAEPHCEDYLSAIDLAVERGLLKRVTRAEFEEDRQQRARETIISCDQWFTKPGRIDFALEGYRRYRQVRTDVFDERRKGLHFDYEALRLTVLGETLDVCKEYADAQKEWASPGWGDESHSTDSVLIGNSAPSPVGPWRLNRFEVVPSGYCIVLSYGWPGCSLSG
jgi:hypothetical protein